MGGRSPDDRRAAGPRPEAVVEEPGVARHDANSCRLDPEMIGGDLGEDGFDTLPERRTAGGDLHGARCAQLRRGTLIGTEPALPRKTAQPVPTSRPVADACVASRCESS